MGTEDRVSEEDRTPLRYKPSLVLKGYWGECCGMGYVNSERGDREPPSKRFPFRVIQLFGLLSLVALFILPAAANTFDATATSEKPTIDGTVETAWHNGALPSRFVQLTPAIGRPATVLTEAFFLYDKQNIYLAARMHQVRSAIHTSQVKRDGKQVLQGDYVEFLLDPLDNGHSALSFAFNPSNSVLDGFLNALDERDYSWDGVLESATSISDSFWSVEVKVPLSSISFQDVLSQDWRIFVTRYYSQDQELSVLQLVDENQPFRISNFPKIRGLVGLEKGDLLQVTPYAYVSRQEDLLVDASSSRGKIGGEVNYAPNPALALLVTVNPDYAQIESDRELINVDDVPATYPEKRPFFTVSSDLYPGLAVNTRNIAGIKFGLRARGATGIAKYDFTTVCANENVWWWMADGRLTDNETFYVDLIGGFRGARDAHDYNVTTNLRTWLFDKRLTAYTWFGTINSRRRDGNEWESVNSIRWISRTLKVGVWNHIKSKFYDPSVVGSPTLSNELIYEGWVNYIWTFDSGFWRTIAPTVRPRYFDLFTDPAHGYLTVDAGVESTIHPDESLGSWTLSCFYRPPLNAKFRFRGAGQDPATPQYEDAYSQFTLVDMRKASFLVEFSSDQSKPVAGTLELDTKPVRGASALITEAEVAYRLRSNFSVYYNLEYADVGGSPFQSEFTQWIHRVKFEYGLAEGMMLRGVVQLNSKRIPVEEYKITSPALNLTFSWEYEPGGNVYLVYSQFDAVERLSGHSQAIGTMYTQSLVLKASRTFGL